MRPDLVVMLAPDLDNDLRFSAAAEPFQAQALVPELAVEAFGAAILPRFSWLNDCHANALVTGPAQQRVGNELRTVVGAQSASWPPPGYWSGRLPAGS